MAVVAKRTVMTLYSDDQDIYSHLVRMVLAEKGVNFEVKTISGDDKPEALLEINPYGSLPTLIDRELVLWDARIIMEYLDERFPHPPLLPVYPVARAESRKMMHRVETDLYTLMHAILEGNKKSAEDGRLMLAQSLVSLGPVFANKPFFMSDEFSLVDCYIAGLLWRLPQLGITLGKNAKQVMDYAKRIFERETFQASLTELERELAQAA